MTDQPAIDVEGYSIPLLGFGTWMLESDDARRMVTEALRIGYRHIDTAWIYKNEEAVGDGIRDALEAGYLNRDDLWLTTKIWVDHFDRDGLLEQARESGLSLGFTPDLLLLHWPKTQPSLQETIDALNEARENGLTRTIGVSNFPSAEFRKAQELSQALLVTNQVEYHPYLKLTKLLETARELDSSITAWSPLAQGKVADDPVLNEIGRAHGKSAAQVTLRWLIQQNVIAIPRTTKESRAAESFNIFDFELSDDEMQRIFGLARPDGRLGDWIDPAFKWDEEWA
ncbi:aldo/keto reductase [Brevundimonas lenta]|uniref:Diketogulonate reductase-like aldo/keto reductase n=1 Tax=Brevundimonas lenta TaxID=424796 RepID=A0A7W6NQK5_9CAUL|nr:aldo/keto reductase [Brevundimonas lenta]MBB4083689.1 diketogulonate reductase-like aldo/keto reductase [Brevundimonas lenta]